MVVTAAACSKSEAPAPSESHASTQAAAPVQTVAATASDNGPSTAQAKEIFNSRCAACHGADGKGNGPGAITLNPKPRNYHDKAWQAQVTDEGIRKTILYGGAAVGKSPIMPASPDLDSKPQVLDGLVKLVREFGKS
jgi:mono/diheme cytochrome c family protein